MLFLFRKHPTVKAYWNLVDPKKGLFNANVKIYEEKQAENDAAFEKAANNFLEEVMKTKIFGKLLA